MDISDSSPSSIVQYPDEDSRSSSEISVDICNWRWNRTGAVSLTFDDGLASQAKKAAPMMTDRGIVGTFFVTTGHCGIPFGANWSEWQRAFDNGHEITSHTIDHPDLTTCSPEDLWEEVVLSKRIIQENITGSRCETFSYPYGYYNLTVLQLVKDTYISARCDDHNITGPPKPEKSHPENMFSTVPCNFGGSETLSQMHALINDTISEKGWLIEMIHAIDGGGWDPVPSEKLGKHLDLLSSMKDQLWIDTYANVSKYITARDEVELKINEKTSSSINISLETSLEPYVYDVPLTLDFTVPGDWIDVEIIEGGSRSKISAALKGSSRRFQLEVPPGRNLSIIRNDTPPEILEDAVYPIYSPLKGNSSTVFDFRVDYISERGRMTESNIFLNFDLNGDGDFTDVVGNMRESGHTMDHLETIEGQILMQVHGSCINFPPATRNISFYFECRDTEGLHARYPASGSIEGPFINDPPSTPTNLRIDGTHDPKPVFYWDHSLDADNDPIYYGVSLHREGEQIHRTNTTNTSFSPPFDLSHGINYSLSINSADDLGAISSESSLNFILSNAPPSAPSNVSIINLDTLTPRVIFDANGDPDGDPIDYKVTLFQGDIRLDSFSIRGNKFSFNQDLREGLKYSFIIQPVDQFGLFGDHFLKEFKIDLVPCPVENITIEEGSDSGEMVRLNWTYNENHFHNISGFEVLVFDREPVSGLEIVPIMNMKVGNVTSASISGLEKDRKYRFSVTPYDSSGNSGPVVVSIEGKPFDNVPPDPIRSLGSYLYTDPLICRLNWDLEPGGDLLGFRIYRNRDSIPENLDDLDPIHTLFYKNLTALEWFDDTIENNRTYHYALIPFDNSGNKVEDNLTWISVDTRVEADNWVPLMEDHQDQNPGREKDESDWMSFLMITIMLLLFVSLIVIFALKIPKQTRKKWIEEE